MKKVRVIGDIHGQIEPYYKTIVANIDHSIQIGDFGIGFGAKPLANPNHRFIRGNHDDPALCRKFPNFIRDGHVEEISEGKGHWMAIGGAWSIDWQFRQPGRTWWYDEECHEFAFRKYIETYEEVKPEIMFTHDGPHSVVSKLMEGKQLLLHKPITETHTSKWLDIFLASHRPKLWIFGHWHHLADQEIHGTRFICLPELGWIDVDL